MLLQLTQIFLAQAGDAQPASPMSSFTGLVPLMLMFVVIYFLLIRPQGKQRREHEALLNSLKKNDEIVTTGGIKGRIVEINDKTATVEISDKVKIQILRSRISGLWNTPAAQTK